MKLVSIVIVLLSFSVVWAKEKIIPNDPQYKPSVIASAPSEYYYLIAEKEVGYLHLYEGHNYLYSYPMTSGISRGVKRREGDKKTPVGIYRLGKHLTSEQLMKKYKEYKMFGTGALTINYPNPVDKKQRKNGSNIWIHGTNQPERLKNKNTSQGCLVLNNHHFDEVVSFAKQNNTILIITDYLSFKKVSENTSSKELFIEAHGQKLVWNNNQQEYQLVE